MSTVPTLTAADRAKLIRSGAITMPAAAPAHKPLNAKRVPFGNLSVKALGGFTPEAMDRISERYAKAARRRHKLGRRKTHSA